MVTGASSGIGAATAELLAMHGARVVLVARTEAAGQEVAQRISSAGGDVLFCRGDVSSDADVAAAVRMALDHYGSIDGAVNNAGIGPRGKAFTELTIEEWREVTDIDLTGIFHCMRHQLAAMRHQLAAMRPGGGAIVNIASVSGILGQPRGGEYVAAKHGVIGATRAAASEFSLHGVRVNAILPGIIVTPLVEAAIRDPLAAEFLEEVRERIPKGHFGEPQDIAHAARYLLSDEAHFVNGATLVVDGGYSAH